MEIVENKSPKRTALIATDLHIRRKHIEAGRRLLTKILNEVKDKQPTYLFLLGDIFHDKDTLSAQCLHIFHDFLEEVNKLCQVIILVGNHDWSTPYTIHSLDSFKHMDNITIVDDVFKLDEENGFVSYCREKERFDEMLTKLGPCRHLYGHLDINDFKVGSGWEEVNAFSEAGDFKNYEKVFSGHLHLAQEKVLENGTEIVFVGTGYTTDFGESDQFKRFILLDLDSGNYESIDTGMTLHKTLKIEAGDPFPELDLEQIKKGVSFRVEVSGTKEKISLLDKPKNYPGIIVYRFKTGETARVDLSITDSRKDLLKKYIDYEKNRSFVQNKDEYDSTRLLKLGEEILNKFKKDL